jgi:hypothetical protein
VTTPTEAVEPLDTYEFDVALSFAGADRGYVTDVANQLAAAHIKYFLDSDYLAETWGEDLVEYFDAVYRKKARYAILFISRHYVESEWARHERRSALARALTERGPYVLPVRLDDAEAEGLRPTVGYVDARRIGVDGLVRALIDKLSGKSSGPRGWPGDRVPRGEREIAAVMAEKPKAWEYLTFAGYLLAGRDALEDMHRDHELGYAEASGERVADEDAIAFLRGSLNEATALNAAMMRLYEPAAQERAFGAPGDPGDPEAIRHLAGRLTDTYRRLMTFSQRLRSVGVSDTFRPLFEAAARFNDRPIRDYWAWVDDLVRQVDAVPSLLAQPDHPQVRIESQLVLAMDDGAVEAFSAELARVKSKLGIEG